MKPYIVKDNQVHFRQGFSKEVLAGLFVTLYALGLSIGETGSKIYPHSVQITESEFLSVLELAEGA